MDELEKTIAFILFCETRERATGNGESALMFGETISFLRELQSLREENERLREPRPDRVNLTAVQLREALEYTNPGHPEDDEEETGIVIQWMPDRFCEEGTPMPAGYYLWYVDCPEEGVIGPLGKQPTHD